MKLPSYFKTVFTLVFSVFCLMSASYLLPSLLLAHGVPAWQAGLVVSAFFIGATPGRLLGSIAIEHLGIKRTILTFALIGAVAATAYLHSSLTVLMVSRIIVGACYSIVYVASTTYQGFTVPEEDRGRLYGYFCLASILPQFVIIPFSELLIDSGAESAYMLLTSAIFILVALYVSRLKIEQGSGTKRSGTQEWGTWGELFRRRETWALVCCAFMLGLSGTSCVQYAPNLMRLQGLKGTFYTWALTPVCVFVRIFFCASMLTKFDRRTAFCAWATFESISLLVAGSSTTVVGFVVAGALYGVSHGFAYPAESALVPDVFPKHLLPKGSALFLLVTDFPPILMPLMMGIVPESVGLAGIILGLGVLCLISFPLIYLFLWRRPPLFREVKG